MFDWHVVRRIAIRNGWNELVDYLSADENWRAYEHFIITGETTPPEKPCGKQMGDAESEKDDEDEGKEVAKEIARRFLAMQKYSAKEIALYTGLSLETVLELQAEPWHLLA